MVKHSELFKKIGIKVGSDFSDKTKYGKSVRLLS